MIHGAFFLTVFNPCCHEKCCTTNQRQPLARAQTCASTLAEEAAECFCVSMAGPVIDLMNDNCNVELHSF